MILTQEKKDELTKHALAELRSGKGLPEGRCPYSSGVRECGNESCIGSDCEYWQDPNKEQLT